LPSITGHRRGRAEVAQAEHGRPVGDDGDGVALDRQAPGVGGVGRDRLADPGDAGGVGPGEVVAVAQADLRLDRQLPAQVQQERPVRHLAHVDAGQRLQRRGDLLRVRLVERVAADVHHERAGVRLHHVEGGDDAPDPADGHREVARRTGRRRHLDAGGDRISGTGNCHARTLSRARRGPTS
jgi:hypothetical protein